MTFTVDMRRMLMRAVSYHESDGCGGCSCGWRQHGKSHAQHLVEIYEVMLIEQSTLADRS